jgi:hypothetical protein
MKFQALTSMKLNSLILLGALSLGIFACNKEEVSPEPKAQVGLQFNTVKTEGTLAGRGTANSVQFDSGYITFSKIEFEAETDNDSTEIEFEFEGTVKLDFATGTTSPNINAISFPAGTYEEIEVEIKLAEGTTEPAVVLNGIFTDALGLVHPLRFEFNSTESFEVEKEGLITFTDNQSVLTQVTFNPVAWFAGVTPEQLSNASENADGVIVISKTSNTAIFDIVEDGLDLASDVEISE